MVRTRDSSSRYFQTGISTTIGGELEAHHGGKLLTNLCNCGEQSFNRSGFRWHSQAAITALRRDLSNPQSENGRHIFMDTGGWVDFTDLYSYIVKFTH